MTSTDFRLFVAPSRRWLVLTILASAGAAMAAPAKAAHASSPKESAWELLVYDYDTERGPKRYLWLGIRNASRADRVMCALSLGYSLRRRDGSIGSAAVGGVPDSTGTHMCEDAAANRLIRAGETSFVVGWVPRDGPNEGPEGRPDLTLEATVVEACLPLGRCKLTITTLSARLIGPIQLRR